MIKYKISKNKINFKRQQTLQMLAARQKKKRIKKKNVPQSGGTVPLRWE
jgi:hypothetical protein